MLNRIFATVTLAATLTIALAGCRVNVSAVADETTTEQKGGTAVAGTLFGTEVSFDSATFDGQLAISEGSDWGWNPSLLIFLFLDEGHIPCRADDRSSKSRFLDAKHDSSRPLSMEEQQRRIGNRSRNARLRDDHQVRGS